MRADLNDGQDVFLDGHVRAFSHFGGVPDRIRYDNLKAAVTKILRGRHRLEAERFVALRSHYGFDSFFCQPGIRALMRRAAWRPRSAGSVVAIWFRSPGPGRWPS